MCSEVSLSRRGARYVVRIDSSFTSESVKAIRSSTLPTKLNSLASDVSADAEEDIFWIYKENAFAIVNHEEQYNKYI